MIDADDRNGSSYNEIANSTQASNAAAAAAAKAQANAQAAAQAQYWRQYQAEQQRRANAQAAAQAAAAQRAAEQAAAAQAAREAEAARAEKAAAAQAAAAAAAEAQAAAALQQQRAGERDSQGANDVENNRLANQASEANAQSNANAAAARETAGFQNRAAEAKDQAAAAALQQQRAGERDSQVANDVENNRLANQAAQVGAENAAFNAQRTGERGLMTTAPGADAAPTSVTVESGMTLSEIAQKYGTTVDALVEKNGIADRNLIMPGQKIELPDGASIPAAPPTGSEHTVQAGETLTEIANRYGTSVNELVKLNGIPDKDLIITGQSLRIPGNGQGGEAGTGAGDGTSYTVQAGDTLIDIAAKHGLDYKAIAAANSIQNPDLIITGQDLMLPGGGDSSGGGDGTGVSPAWPPDTSKFRDGGVGGV